jgi:hypothetical protein
MSFDFDTTCVRSVRVGAILCGVVLLCGVLLGRPVSARAQGAGDWLAQAVPDNWNQPTNMGVPTAPQPNVADVDPRCGEQERSSESPEEDQVVAQGWRLFNAAEVGWGVRLVDGLVSYDGMCRPLQLQGFVFAGGQFAGTIAPQPMDSRTDGVGRILDIRGPGNLTGQFVRYAPTDPLCCPSATFVVQYSVDRSGSAPVLVPVSSMRTNAP